MRTNVKKPIAFLLSALMLLTVMSVGIIPLKASAATYTLLASSADSSTWNNTEGLAKMFDGSTGTKWCVGLPSGGLWVIFDAGASRIAKSYTMTTANDTASYPERNPRDWKLYGSNNADYNGGGGQWTEIASVSNDSVIGAANYQAYSFSPNAPGAYRYYKLHITALKGGGPFQLSEFSLNFAPSDCIWVAGADASSSSSEKSVNVFDNNTGTKWCANSASETLFVTCDMGRRVVIDGYTITTANDNASATGRNPQNWDILGSNDNANWALVERVTNDNTLQNVNYTPYNFTISHVKQAYRYYKYVVTAKTAASTFQISELKYHVVSPASVSGTADETYLSAQNVLTGDTAIRYESAAANAALTFDMGKSVVSTGYTLTSAGDAAKNPTAWTLSGSADGTAWTQIDTVTGVSLPAANGAATAYTFDFLPEAYRYYKLDMSASETDAVALSGFSLQYAAHSFTQFESNHDATHQKICPECGLSVTENCTGLSSTNGVCSVCNGSSAYAVTLSAPDATVAGTASVNAVYTQNMVSVTPPLRSGYTFNGFFDAETDGKQYYDANGTSAAAWDKLEASTLYARWTANNDTPYMIYDTVMNSEGSYTGVEAAARMHTGTTDTTVNAADVALDIAHYSLDTESGDASININGDGSSVLNLYYKLNSYTVLFKNAAGETVQTDTLYYGAVPAYTGATPTLAATGENTYTFLGWTANAPAEPGSDAAYYAAGNLPPVTADVTYYPYFGAAVNSYDITFTVDGVDTVLSFPYGATPVFSGVPEKAADAHAIYTFSGWSPALAPVTADATYTAQFSETVKSYPVFVNAGAGSDVSIGSQMAAHDTLVDFTVTVKEGYDPDTLVITANGADISALGEDQGNGVYAYSIRVLTDTAIEVADLTKYTYEITFVAGDETVTKTVAYGETPVYGKTPAKAADAQYTYTFTGWDAEIVPAAANATYTAQFSATPVKYLITTTAGKGARIEPHSTIWEFGGNVGLLVNVEAGYDPDTLTVLANGVPLPLESHDADGYRYSVYVDGDVTVTVPDLTKYTYTITFKVGDDKTTKTVAYGETPDYGSVPTKAADDVNFYAFSGWSPAIVPATEDATYTAQFEATPIPAHEHDFATLVRTVAATCVSAGYDEYICDCGMTEQRNATAIDPANHAKNPILVGKREASETEDGYSGDLICPACGETITEGHVEPKTAVPHEHDFATLVSHADATCAAKAFDIYACACGETQKIETGEVNPDNHVGLVTVGAKDATETEYGYTGDTVCTACGSVLAAGEVIEKTVVPHVHSFDTVIESGEATCVAKAYTVKQCACGETERTETGEVNPDNHAGNIILVGAREATATQGGYTGDKICTACGATVETGTFTDPTDPGHTHDYAEIVETAEATCVAKAYTIYQCACGDTKKVETGSLNPDNHIGEIKTYGAHEATDTLDGYTGDKVCAACGKVVEAGSVIPHTGSTTPDTPTNPDTPDDGGSNSDTRISFLDWLRNLIKKILSLFNFGGDNSPC